MRRRMMLIMFRRRGRILVMLLVRGSLLALSTHPHTHIPTYPPPQRCSRRDFWKDRRLIAWEIGGYKATLKNPNVSDEAKQHAKEVLEESEIMS
jgi:hypothetical protein